MRERGEFGTPYSVGEARQWLDAYGDRIDIYPRELMAFLIERVEKLEGNLPACEVCDRKIEPGETYWSKAPGIGGAIRDTVCDRCHETPEDLARIASKR